ncbi:hypothetical protein J5U23_01637 [Saccharolobus shibatae B12]|uniref:Uncharacterized protein n=1 Tax=Saccharolobus shibatae (strain ATCC 51178 / DSM 5389 / JCM 8931 / NBRC 15437 / B12) TaxID=523848 RepID=A0A8F5GTB5_SACSH|nr:hypothetical protein [Saccharolobus shibatae]QXJ28768.1 hypothetical protein J5U23_01637 [Saccharolobus shibatae B12]
MKKLFTVVGSIFSGSGIWLKLVDKPIPAVKIITDNGTLIKMCPLQPVTTQLVHGILNSSQPIPIEVYNSSTGIPVSSSLTIYYIQIPPPWYANLWPEVLTIGIIMLGIAIFSWIKLKFRK